MVGDTSDSGVIHQAEVGMHDIGNEGGLMGGALNVEGGGEG